MEEEEEDWGRMEDRKYWTHSIWEHKGEKYKYNLLDFIPMGQA